MTNQRWLDMEREGKVMPRPRTALPPRLDIPVGRVRRMLRSKHSLERISSDGPSYLASVMKYLTAETVQFANMQIATT